MTSNKTTHCLAQDDIDALHDKFKVQYPHSAASKGSKTRDLPPVSGSIIWARQIDQQLTMYLKRVEDVLGECDVTFNIFADATCQLSYLVMSQV